MDWHTDWLISQLFNFAVPVYVFHSFCVSKLLCSVAYVPRLSSTLFFTGLCNKKLGRLEEGNDCFYKLHAILRNSPQVMYQIADTYPCFTYISFICLSFSGFCQSFVLLISFFLFYLDCLWKWISACIVRNTGLLTWLSVDKKKDKIR